MLGKRFSIKHFNIYYGIAAFTFHVCCFIVVNIYKEYIESDIKTTRKLQEPDKVYEENRR